MFVSGFPAVDVSSERYFRVLCRSCDNSRRHSPYYDIPHTNCPLVDTSNEMVVQVSAATSTSSGGTSEMNTNVAPSSLKFGWLVPIAILFVISFPPVTCIPIFYNVVLNLLTSFSVMKSSQYFVASYGVYGSASPLCALVLLLEKSEIFSAYTIFDTTSYSTLQPP